ncbi:replication initiator protein [Capybara microvirus Cap1_SP_259]|nr:replication initiator protein [Capybara microvirus Cap1_SP_259]
MSCRCYSVYHCDRGYYFAPCGQCLNCRLKDIRDWFVRSMFEAKKLDTPYHYFLTLTYDNDHLPADGFASREDLKNFLNYLKKNYKGDKIRYYATSDYGGRLGRAHFHLLLFCSCKLDKKRVLRIWHRGITKLLPLRDFYIKYVCKYTVKKRDLVASDGYINPKAFFRLVSHHYGDNGVDFFNGFDNFLIFGGKKYGFPKYIVDKIIECGLDVNNVFSREATRFYRTRREAYSELEVFCFDNDLSQVSGIQDYNDRQEKLKHTFS